ncbi:lipocalin family protein [Candidatus Nitrosacidococcus sp. I8]|uniref:lipocalin family protein n=1 Tax=Candidatus Nitrosacidococcus sp. I8 TaxID=2942908 RepID=UPI0022261BCB|nr:lipocalin family protein [Candidatus Nitrosacidococcus sp. I8]
MKKEKEIISRKQSLSLINQLLNTVNIGFSQVDVPWQFLFPRDHGAHSSYQNESWNFAGNLRSDQRRDFGFQFNFFRMGLKSPDSSQSTSLWRFQELYRGYFGLADILKSQFYPIERFSRTALGLSGASSTNNSIKVWLEDWRFQVLSEEEAKSSFSLFAKTENASIDLILQPLKLPFYFGGDSQASLGNFYAYTLPRLMTKGTIKIKHSSYPVTGLSWFDHSWGKIPIPTGSTVWDRFLLQLDNGVDLLVLRLHRIDGTGTPINNGTLVTSQGEIETLTREDIALNPLSNWKSPNTHISYPTHWQLQIPEHDIDLNITPSIENQELNLSLDYWSGSVTVTGYYQGNNVIGKGFQELTGYQP